MFTLCKVELFLTIAIVVQAIARPLYIVINKPVQSTSSKLKVDRYGGMVDCNLGLL